LGLLSETVCIKRETVFAHSSNNQWGSTISLFFILIKTASV
jgi:hypothetical protein